MSGIEKADKLALQRLIAANCVAFPLVTHCYDLSVLFSLSSL
jgi:hypothetical protein